MEVDDTKRNSRKEKIIAELAKMGCDGNFVRWTLYYLTWHREHRMFLYEKTKENPKLKKPMGQFRKLHQMRGDQSLSSSFRRETGREGFRVLQQLFEITQEEESNWAPGSEYKFFEMMDALSGNSVLPGDPSRNVEEIESNLAVIVLSEHIRQKTGEPHHSKVTALVNLLFPIRKKRKGAKLRWLGRISTDRLYKLSEKYPPQLTLKKFEDLYHKYFSPD